MTTFDAMPTSAEIAYEGATPPSESEMSKMKHKMVRDVQIERKKRLGTGFINGTELLELEGAETFEACLRWYNRAMFESMTDDMQNKAEEAFERAHL
ncbi:hypothetical protein N0B31_18665 [Salinirubellus salinus]|uniref:Uncharacterized protein n=1 Tax=Salinirubellus salinus TaxID=1364945 RepID=A0A9E7R1P9_9EURY|nr:hypothetical protein [Salinirubellus salinus]UWM54126.1 hypothetical protein N0B31_18665 [Salinirubellus salinus]